jgi:hypothetical protein
VFIIRRILSLLTQFSCQRAESTCRLADCQEITDLKPAILVAGALAWALAKSSSPGGIRHIRSQLSKEPSAWTDRALEMVELIGFEPTTSAVQGRRSPN